MAQMTQITQMFAGDCKCALLCAGLHWCAGVYKYLLLCAAIPGCKQVCSGVHVCVCAGVCKMNFQNTFWRLDS